MKMLLLLAVAFVAPVAHAADLLRTAVIPPAEAVRAGGDVELVVASFNSTDQAVAFAPVIELNARLVIAGRDEPVRLRRQDPLSSATVPPRGFVETPYVFSLPASATGLVVVEIVNETTGTLRTVLTVAADDEPLPSVLSPATAEVTDTPLRPADQISAQRTFAGRFAAHEPVYFIYGPDTPGAKFQFSFKYRLLAFDAGEGIDGARTGSRLQFGYTQRSLWDIDAESSPFYDSSYMPSLFYELISTPEKSDGGLNWLGLQSGVQHESNGRDGLDSRSLNTLFLRTGLVAGRMDGWHLTASLRAYGYVTSLSDNPDIADYRGYADWLVTISHGNGAMLSYAGRAGRDFERFSTQLDLSIPVRFRLFDFATYFLIQYHNGYGESLRSYETKSETVRAGLSFVR